MHVTTLLVAAGCIAVLVVVAGWYVKRRFERMGQHLPGALAQWEKEIEKLEKPKG